MNQLYSLPHLKERRRILRQSSTPQEIILWSRIKNKQLGYKFRRQHSIGNYIVDFYCSDKKIIVELDGGQHNDEKEYDDKRTRYLNSLGLNVLRFWDNEVNGNLNGVLEKIQEHLI